MKIIKEKNFKKFNIVNITKTDFLKLDLSYQEEEKVKLDERSHAYIPVTKSVKKLFEENLDFWKEHCNGKPLLFVTHKKLTEEEKKEVKGLEKYADSINMPEPKKTEFIENQKKLDVFNEESFLIKYYCETPSTILFYPACDIENSCFERGVFFFNCAGEEIIVSKKEIDTIYLIDLEK